MARGNCPGGRHAQNGHHSVTLPCFFLKLTRSNRTRSLGMQETGRRFLRSGQGYEAVKQESMVVKFRLVGWDGEFREYKPWSPERVVSVPTGRAACLRPSPH